MKGGEFVGECVVEGLDGEREGEDGGVGVMYLSKVGGMGAILKLGRLSRMLRSSVRACVGGRVGDARVRAWRAAAGV